MQYLTFTQPEKTSYPVVLLVPSIRKDDIRKAYIAPYGVDPEDVLVIQLHTAQGKKKTPAGEIREWFAEEVTEVLTDIGAQYLLVADSDYFKVLTKASKVEPNLGYVMDCVLGPWKVIYVPNYRAIFYDPEKVNAKIAAGMTALQSHRGNAYAEPGKDIIHLAEYPIDPAEIEDWLKTLLSESRDLTCDIETFDLKHPVAGIGTISFAWSENEGIAFPVDLGPDPERVRKALRHFFENFTGKLIYHRISFDVYILIYQLFMEHLLDNEGLLTGLKVMLRDWDCTKLIAYLALNSCSGNRLGLKDLAQEFAGNYAKEEIEDIRSIPLEELLEYNLIDSLSTWYVHNKHYPQMVADQQLEVYEGIFQPATVDIIQMQLTGMPIDMDRVKEVRKILEADNSLALAAIESSPIIHGYIYHLNQAWVIKRNSELKKKRVSLADAKEIFNPNSGPQLQELLYEVLELPVIALTDSKLPATDSDTLRSLRNHTTNQEVIDLLNALLDYKAVNKILTSFLPAMEGAFQGPDGWHYLFGNFNLGGTVSGRLSSSEPNLQNLPASGTRYAKIIKSCFVAPPGWLFTGLDFDSLEDRISALTTKDPNKLKVYTDGYDGHSLRAYSYFGEQMPDIDPDSVTSINSIEKKYKPLRQESKAPTFALTYQGTFKTLMTNCGFSQEKAKLIETRYHEMYAVSDAWVAAKLDQACKDGYVTVAFGLRVRTPLLAQVIRGTSKTPHEAEAEGRTAGNALGQSWCLLNSRAGSQFMGEVRKSVHRNSIKPSAQIHDAQYFLIRDDIEAIQFANERLVNAVQWQDHADIEHPQVKLGGKLGIFYPSWVNEITLPNGASEEDIIGIVADHLTEAAA